MSSLGLGGLIVAAPCAMPTRVKTHEPHVAPGGRNRPPRSRLLAFRAADIDHVSLVELLTNSL
jgi:hypothetical protein